MLAEKVVTIAESVTHILSHVKTKLKDPRHLFSRDWIPPLYALQVLSYYSLAKVVSTITPDRPSFDRQNRTFYCRTQPRDNCRKSSLSNQV
jgi:hypothetical protein